MKQTYKVFYKTEIDVLDRKVGGWVNLTSCCHQAVVVLEPKDLKTHLYSSSGDINYETSKLLENHVERFEEVEEE